MIAWSTRVGGADEVNAAVDAASAASRVEGHPGWSSGRACCFGTGIWSRRISTACAWRVSRAREDVRGARGSLSGASRILARLRRQTLLFGNSEILRRNVDCETSLQPMGVCVGITLQLPRNGAALDVPARDRLRQHVRPQAQREIPLTALADLLLQVGVPKGVLNVVHGGRARRCAADPSQGQAVSFVGSTPVATIYETGTRNGKRVQRTAGEELHRGDARCRRALFCGGACVGGLGRAASAAWPDQPPSPSGRRRTSCSRSCLNARAIKRRQDRHVPAASTWDWPGHGRAPHQSATWPTAGKRRGP